MRVSMRLPKLVAQSADRRLKEAIGKDERSENPAPAFRRDMEIVLYTRAGRRSGNAVEKRDDRQGQQEQRDLIALFQLAAATGCSTRIARAFWRASSGLERIRGPPGDSFVST